MEAPKADKAVDCRTARRTRRARNAVPQAVRRKSVAIYQAAPFGRILRHRRVSRNCVVARRRRRGMRRCHPVVAAWNGASSRTWGWQEERSATRRWRYRPLCYVAPNLGRGRNDARWRCRRSHEPAPVPPSSGSSARSGDSDLRHVVDLARDPPPGQSMVPAPQVKGLEEEDVLAKTAPGNSKHRPGSRPRFASAKMCPMQVKVAASVQISTKGRLSRTRTASHRLETASHQTSLSRDSPRIG